MNKSDLIKFIENIQESSTCELKTAKTPCLKSFGQPTLLFIIQMAALSS